MTALDIACAADARYLAHSAAMLHSLVSSQNGVPVKSTSSMDQIWRRRLRPLQTMLAGTSGSLVPHEIDRFGDRGTTRLGSDPDDDVVSGLSAGSAPRGRRVLYLDVDVLVLASLSDLGGSISGPATWRRSRTCRSDT